MLNKMTGRRSSRPNIGSAVAREHPPNDGMLPEHVFTKMLAVERKRTERSGGRFVLMLLEGERALLQPKERLASKLIRVLAQTARDTDLRGWYNPSAIGVIFTEIGAATPKQAVQTISARFTDALLHELSVEELNTLRLTFHVFPEDWDETGTPQSVSAALNLALAAEVRRRKADLAIKRLMDIAGSIAALIFLLPVFLAIVIAVKVTSKGPVLFKQVRLGQYGRKFTFFKFRSMYVNTDHAIHEAYIQQFISGGADAQPRDDTRKQVYKLVADPRVTPVGHFLRKTSLDELPQFLNVLTGDMSLVGPRPPVLYEYKRYHLWHKQRLLAAKPGITGLWQVVGRSRVKFDDMVRLDIRYARTRSLWLDIKILLKTPRAVISGEGAC